MIKKYKTTRNGIEITEVKALRETAKSVVFTRPNGDEQRELKRTEWHIYHDTWDAAYLNLLNRCEMKIHSAEARLRIAKEEYAKVLEMPSNASLQERGARAAGDTSPASDC